MKNILFTLNSAPEFAGVQRYILNLAIGLSQTDIKPIIWLNKNSDFVTHLKAHNIEFYEYSGSIYKLKNILSLKKLITTRNITIIHANLGGAAIVSVLMKLITTVNKVIYTQHFISPASTQSNFVKRTISKYIFILVYSQISTVVAISNSVKEAILARKELPANKIKVVYNGILVIGVSNKQQTIPNILLVTRLSKEKGVSEFLKAIAPIQKEKFNITIVGAGEEEQTLKSLAKKLNILDKTNFIGHVSDVSSYYQNADIFVNPTYSEAFGLAIIEAMSTKLPIVAFNNGGPKDIIINNETGFLVDSYEEMAEKIHLLLSNPKLRKEMGSKSFERFNQLFTIAKMTENTIEAYS